MNNPKKQNLQHAHGIRVSGDNLGRLLTMQKSAECQARPVVDNRNVNSTTKKT